MGVSDIIKGSVLDSLGSSDLSIVTILITLGIAAVMGLFIYVVYRISTRGGFYNRGFNKALASMPVITSGIMLAMQSNMVISLGMVGALSIVRFRNAIKDSSDLTFLFWSISMGIITGSGMYDLALLLSLCMSVLVFFLDWIPVVRAPYMLVISAESELCDEKLVSCIKKHCSKSKMRSHNITKRGTEWIFELQTKEECALVRSIAELEYVVSVNLLSHDGEVRF